MSRPLNPFEAMNMAESDIQAEFYKNYKETSDNPYTALEISQDVDRYSNMLVCIGEMISRCKQETLLVKFEADTQQAVKKVEQREKWVKDHPGEKVPSIDYFEALGEIDVKLMREKQYLSMAKLSRYEKTYDSYKEKINALKKMHESFKMDGAFNA